MMMTAAIGIILTQGAAFCLVHSRCHQEQRDLPSVIAVCSGECHALPLGHRSSMPVVQMGHRHHFKKPLVSTVILKIIQVFKEHFQDTKHIFMGLFSLL